MPSCSFGAIMCDSKPDFAGLGRFLNDSYRDRRRHSNSFNRRNLKWFCASIGVFSACLPAVSRMTYGIENRSSREFQVMSGFKRKHSEAERASQGTNPIILCTLDFMQSLCLISSENDDVVASCVRHRANFLPSGSLFGRS